MLEHLKGRGGLSLGKKFDGGFESRVFLADNLIQLGGPHSGLLQLLEWPPGFDALVLARVADQEHAVVGAEPRKEVANLVGAGETRLIEEVEVLLCRGARRCASRARKPCKVPASIAGFIELSGGAGCGRKALNFVSLALHGTP